MNIINLINKKQRGKALNLAEINWFVNAVLNKTIADYQITAFLMAIWFKGMNPNELFLLTKAMVDTGEIIKFNHHGKISVDKHSTGGIGDKVSLALVPILTSLGFSVAKLSGRGLGYTGGTIDKLEAVGVKTELTDQQAQACLDKNDCFIIGQSKDIAPVDKVLYGLRDITGTVDSLPLIASSIMSKKLAVMNEYIFIDFKYGKGAFCKTKKIANELAKLMQSIAKSFKRKLSVKLSDMNQVLGKAVGNVIEVNEAVNFLKQDLDQVGQDFIDLMQTIVINILLETKQAKTKQKAIELYQDVLTSKKAWNRFLSFIESQGGNVELFTQKEGFFKPKYKASIKAEKSGILHFTDPIDLAKIGINLGAGRMKKTDQIDPMAGLFLMKKDNESVAVGDTVLNLYSSSPISNEYISAAQKTIIINK